MVKVELGAAVRVGGVDPLAAGEEPVVGNAATIEQRGVAKLTFKLTALKYFG